MDRRHTPRLLREEALTFFGRTVAGQSHEVTNVLNIINELAGLQLDMLQAAASGATPPLSRLAQLADKIQQQVVRGETIVRFVNRFAHSVDVDVRVYDVREMLETVAAVSARPARLARVELVTELPAEAIAVEGNPFCLQHLVAVLVEVALAAATDKRLVTLACRARGDGAEVVVASADPLARPDPRLLALASVLAEELGAQLTSDGSPGDDPHRFVVVLPRTRARSDDEGGDQPLATEEATHGE